MTLTPLAAADPKDIETLLDAAFGADRRERTAYRLRAGVDWLPELSFAAWRGEGLVGSLQSWPVALRSDEGVETLVMVGPVAVAPAFQGQGMGKSLMDALIAAAVEQRADALMMIGDPDYYGRWDFTAVRTGGWRIDAPYEQHRLLARLQRAMPGTGRLMSLRQVERVSEPSSA